MVRCDPRRGRLVRLEAVLMTNRITWWDRYGPYVSLALVLVLAVVMTVVVVSGARAHEPEHDGYHFPPAVEQWRGLVVDHFQTDDVHMALHIIDCESNGDRWVHNATSGTAGLFQHRPIYWHRRAELSGLHPADMHSAHDNIHVGAWLIYKNGGIKHWERCGPWAVAHA